MPSGGSDNVVAAIAEFFVPGLGFLVQGRLREAFIAFLVTAFLVYIAFLLGPFAVRHPLIQKNGGMGVRIDVFF